MALSNKEKVGRALTAVAEGLKPFVDSRMSATLPAGKDWVDVIAARENAKDGTSKTFKADDPRFLLKVLTDEWRVFQADLNRQQSNLASELRAVGNVWAHEPSLSSDDTYRALDTAARLLTAVGAKDQADAVTQMRLEHQRQVFDEQTRKTVRAQTDVVSVPGTMAGTSIKSWREVITPHQDVATGQFNAAEFAADLHQVATGQATSPEYADPLEFFRRTYVTTGLSELLEKSLRRASGDMNSSPVMNLQTQFGGGKTHSMLALYHLFSGINSHDLPQAVQEIVGRVFPGGVADADPLASLSVKRVTLVGTHLSPSQPLIKADGTQVRTLWGELAWQLGGRAAFDRITSADMQGVPPGDVLADLVREHSPALILIDEWVAYARLLVDKDGLPGGGFAAQFTFAQHLTELVQAIPGTMLVVSIPASDTLNEGGAGSALEVGGEHGRRALERLQHVIGRTADEWRPATGTESFEIVKRRLFEEPDAAARADIAAVARQYTEYYRANTGQFPRDTTTSEYEARIRAAYPIHPELFDRLYEDWSTLEKFQRTRGVLRLMSTVIHQLWTAGDSAPLISPGTVPVHTRPVFSELTKYLADQWKPIVDTDIDGEGSTPVKIDSSRPSFGGRALTRRIARAVFLGSAPTLGTAHKGIDRQNLWLGVAVPGDSVGHFGDALEMLGQRATYLYAESGRYWYDTTASISRQAVDRAERLAPDDVWVEIEKRLRSEERGDRGMFAGVHTAASDSGNVPDVDEARLVILHPKYQHSKDNSEARAFAEEVLQRVGNGQRKHRNMLVMVAAERSRAEEVEAAAREYLAWSSIVADADDLDLRPQQKAQAAARASEANGVVSARLRAAYSAAFVPEQPDPGKPAVLSFLRIPDGAGTLASRASERLRRGQQLSVAYAPVNIRMALDDPSRLGSVWSKGHVSLKDLWDLYATYPYLDRLRDRRVLEDAVLAAGDPIMWQLESFALARGYDEAADVYDGLWIPQESGEPLSVNDTTLLVRLDKALAQRATEVREAHSDSATSDGDNEASDHETTGRSGTVALPKTVKVLRRFYGSKRLDPERYGRDWANVSQEVLQHLAASQGAHLEVTIEIHATNPDGFSEQTIRTVTENAETLKLEQKGFDED